MTDPHLDPDRLIHSVEILSRRIFERFPESSLYGVSQQLVEVSKRAKQRANWIAQPITPLRLGFAALVLALLVGGAWTLRSLGLPTERPGLVEWVTILDAGINDILLIGAGLFFLITFETRIKRQRALDALHGLRTLAHLVDMHQLHKDPERVLRRGDLTPSTPRIELTPFELSRYLDYCSELQSLIGKVAALYGQVITDPVVIDAVSDVEQLTTGTSRKIWQKLMILHTLDVQSARASAGNSACG